MPGRSARDARDRLKCGIGDSNPGRLVGSQESCRWTNPAASSISEAEGEGVEPSRLIARPSSSRVPSPIGLPFRIEELVEQSSFAEFEHRREESNLQSSP